MNAESVAPTSATDHETSANTPQNVMSDARNWSADFPKPWPRPRAIESRAGSDFTIPAE